MKISGFTIARNAIKYNYPLVESILSILPICDEFIVNVGDSDDDTLRLVCSIGDDKIRIVQNQWDMSMGSAVLSHQTNLALQECAGDWAFYLQSDEVVHEKDLDKIHRSCEKYLDDEQVDALRFKWLHFYGSYNRYRIDKGWYQKQDRIVRNNGQIQSIGDAWGFGRVDGKEMCRKNTNSFIYHYGWVMPQDIMKQRRLNAEQIGFIKLNKSERENNFSYQDLRLFPAYFGSHPSVMKKKIHSHQLSREDLQRARSQYWWHPCHLLGLRYKTGQRVNREMR